MVEKLTQFYERIKMGVVLLLYNLHFFFYLKNDDERCFKSKLKLNMKLQLMLLTVFLLKFCSLFGNGGPVLSDYSFNEGNYGIQLTEKKDIKLVKEDLNFLIKKDEVEVTAYYLLRNTADDCEMKYGFAVDYRDDKEHNHEWSDYISNFKIIENGVQLKHISEKTDKDIEVRTYDINVYDVVGIQSAISRKWFLSALSFKKNEVKTLVVQYTIKPHFTDLTKEPDAPELEKNIKSKRYVDYYLTPSGFWGDGYIGTLNLNVSFDNPYDYYDFKVSGLEMDKNQYDYSYSYSKSNINLKEKGSLSFSFLINDEYTVDEFMHFGLSNLNDSMITTNINQLPKYPISNLFDKKTSTAFVYNATLINEGELPYIEIDFKSNESIKVEDIYCISMLNGYTKSKNVYLNNNIVTIMKVILKGSEDDVVYNVELSRKNIDFNLRYKRISRILWVICMI